MAYKVKTIFCYLKNAGKHLEDLLNELDLKDVEIFKVMQSIENPGKLPVELIYTVIYKDKE